MDLTGILGLINALAPLVAPAVVTVETVVGSLTGAGVITDAQADADLEALIGDALAAKAEADRAAAGNDPR